MTFQSPAACEAAGTGMYGLARVRSRKLLHLTLLLFLGAAPIQWYSFTSGWAGALKPFHLAAAALGLILIAMKGTRADLRRVVQRSGSLSFLLPTFVVLSAAVTFWWGRPWGTFVRDSVYVMGGVVVGLVFVRFSSDVQLRRVTLWSAPVAVCSFVVFAQMSLPTANFPAIILDALKEVDPAIIQYQLFGPLFRSEGLAAQASLRHGVFIAILFALWLTVASLDQLPGLAPYKRVIVRLSMAAAVGLVVMSLSRAAIVALLLPALGLALRPLVTGRASRRAFVGAGVAAFSLFLGVLSGALRIVWERFTTETASYEARSEVTSETLANLNDAAMLGRESVALAPHNFMLNALIGGGILLALVALAICVKVIALATRLWWRSITSTDVDRLARAGFALLAIPIVRMFTAAAGLTIVEWAAVVIAACWRSRYNGVAEAKVATKSSTKGTEVEDGPLPPGIGASSLPH